MLTMAPETSSSSSNFGMAVISLDLLSTATWPSTRCCSVAQALTKCKAALPEALSKERRMVLPSMAIRLMPKPSLKASIQR